MRVACSRTAGKFENLRMDRGWSMRRFFLAVKIYEFVFVPRQEFGIAKSRIWGMIDV